MRNLKMLKIASSLKKKSKGKSPAVKVSVSLNNTDLSAPSRLDDCESNEEQHNDDVQVDIKEDAEKDNNGILWKGVRNFQGRGLRSPQKRVHFSVNDQTSCNQCIEGDPCESCKQVSGNRDFDVNETAKSNDLQTSIDENLQHIVKEDSAAQQSPELADTAIVDENFNPPQFTSHPVDQFDNNLPNTDHQLEKFRSDQLYYDMQDSIHSSDSTRSYSSCSADTTGIDSDQTFFSGNTSSIDSYYQQRGYAPAKNGSERNIPRNKGSHLSPLLIHRNKQLKSIEHEFGGLMVDRYPYDDAMYSSTPPQGSITPKKIPHTIELERQPSTDCYPDLVLDASCSSSTIHCLSDDLLLHIFTFLSTRDLCKASKTCHLWYRISWSIELWNDIDISGIIQYNADQVFINILERLACSSPYACLEVRSITAASCPTLTDNSLTVISRRCPELQKLNISYCSSISGDGIAGMLGNCPNLESLAFAGCQGVDSLECVLENGLSFGENASFFQLQYLDMSDCLSFDDSLLQLVARSCSYLKYLYLRRCTQITDQSIINVSLHCNSLREISLCDCYNVHDNGIKTLVKRCHDLRYISLAKCSITDIALKSIARYCRKLRYFNAHMCDSISDVGISKIAQNCHRLRSLDIGKCHLITDRTLNYLAINSHQLRRLSIKSCHQITDAGLRKLATHRCSSLKYLNIQDCEFSFETYAYVRRRCRWCIIEHTKPEFY